MSHALVTVAAPIAVGKIAEAHARIEALGNPAADGLAQALGVLEREEGVHFASLHAIPPTDRQSAHGHLVLEFSADGAEDVAVARIVHSIGPQLQGVFELASDRGGGDLAGYLQARKVKLGQGWFGRAGLAFAGTPGMTVGRIRREAKLADHIAGQVGAQDSGLGPLQRLQLVREDVRSHPEHAWALETPTSLPIAPSSTILGLIAQMALSFVATYLWPLAIPLAVVLLFGLGSWLMGADASHAWADLAAANLPMKAWLIVHAAWGGLKWALGALMAFAIPVVAILAAVYALLRRKEQTDWLDERAPQRDVLAAILENENQLAHNHMVSVTQLKPGPIRMFTVKLAFWIIGQLALRKFLPGRLGEIGTIHFARWVTLPGGRDFVFFSNYGGSWESYLEDFITKAHNGLTAVWSNTLGFPRTQNLFQGGATDGERFKRYARRSMIPTPFWYSAYPTLTTDNIRTNATIRCGLAAAMTDEEAIAWLALFGSAARPPGKLESNQIQSLLFGGLGFMPYGTLLLVDLADDMPAARGWLRDIRAEIAFDDGRRLERKAVLTLGLGPGALAKAGLPGEAIETFPPAYLDGMTGPGRGRILGDVEDDEWWWRRSGAYDAAVLVYGSDARSAAALVRKIKKVTAGYGHAVERSLPLNPIPKARQDRVEPFGFVDGTSQPVIRGTYRGLRNADPIHLVEPGEFILGYPDNRGNIPPGPELAALHDPDNRLPIRGDITAFGSNIINAPREIGRNGSFLVIRQLEQDHDGFWAYCAAEAARLRTRLSEPYKITAEFIGAKLIGRWKDGSSLARNPYQPFTKADERLQHPTRRPASTTPLTPISPPPGDAPAAAAASSAPGKVAAKDAGSRRWANPEDNDFLFGAEDPQGLRCPFGAHIRRANPRDSLSPGSNEQIEISNRHRILRVGRTYAPQAGEKNGLMFMCLNGDIERQFEFVQQTWLGSETFHGLSGERDPLAGARAGCPNGFTMPTRDGPVRLSSMARFVTPRGGGYFFLPGKRLLEFLSE
jgi:deferrochelatase/peroxidase EfeB